MRLYSLVGAEGYVDPEYGSFEPGPDGGFDFPDDLSDQLQRFHHRRQPLWETELGRQQRLVAEELERRKDPGTLLAAVEQILQAARAVAAPPAAAEPTQPAEDPPAKGGRRRPRTT